VNSRGPSSPRAGKIGIETYHLLVVVIEPFRNELLLFAFQGLQFLLDVRINEVSDILAIHDLGDYIELPLRIF
jgi:hypothetical protein